MYLALVAAKDQKDRRLSILVSSVVYGYEDLLESVYTLLETFGYEVLMSHKGTVPIDPDNSAMTSCLEAAQRCAARMDVDILKANSEAVLQALELPYRVVIVCTGELGRGQVKKYDIETYMPSRGSYGETHSASSFGQFQARRLNLRYRDRDNKLHFCQTLNNTVIASPRILISILELYQNVDGSITIPSALRPYMNGRERIVAG